MKAQENIPPKAAEHFLSWFCKDELQEEILGDLQEYYDELVESPKWKRNLLYWFHLLNFLRPFAIKNIMSANTNHYAMFRHNLLISLRTNLRNKMSFFINLIGLSTGLACAMLIFLWVSDELNMDKFHKKDAQLFQVMQHRPQGGELVTSSWVPALTAQTLEEEMPEVELAVPAWGLDVYTLSADDKDISAKGQYVGNNFFNLFSFPLIHGESNRVLSDKKSIVINKSTALSLFNSTENVVGKSLELQHKEQYQITGIFEDVHGRSSMQFDFLLPFEIIMTEKGWAKRWQTSWPETFVLLKPGADVHLLNNKIADLISRKTEGEVSHRTLFVAPYAENYLYGSYENGKQVGGRIVYVKLFSIVAIIILLIACVNFMNLSTAKATRRVKEVGIKKAIGAGRSSLIIQYLSEAVIIAFMSLLLSIVLVVVILPEFNQITSKQLSLRLDSLSFILLFLAITLFTGFVAGSYPALYLSGFNPVKVLKGVMNNSTGELWVRKGLVTIQFVVSIILIVSVLVVYKQIEFVQNKNLGYNKNNVLYFSRVNWNDDNLEAFISEAKKLPGVSGVSGMGHDMTGHIAATYGVQWPGKDPDDRTEFEMMPVISDLPELLGMEIIKGRFFLNDETSENNKVIFNEAAIEHMGLTEPIGATVEFGNTKREIVGVVKNFNFESLHEKVKPIIFWPNPSRIWSVVAKIEVGKEQDAIVGLQSLFKTFYPGFPFEFKFMDQEYQSLYAGEQRVSTLSKYFAGLAILISCLGLFGLTAFTAERRTKEIGIRKILGSSVFNIVRLLSGDFTKMVVTAITIALPISYFIANRWLDNFVYRINLNWWIFVGAGMSVFLIAWFTVGIQTVKAARINPVECLRDE